jgi:tRNA-splicing ligase RtcB
MTPFSRTPEASACAGFEVWGKVPDPDALAQMQEACRLPVAVSGVLLPDAHVGYGLPIGGVLAARRAVIPYAVGMDIACRMCLSVFDEPPERLPRKMDTLCAALEHGTAFGVGAYFSPARSHAVMDEDWSFSPVLRRNKDLAWKQLGTSGAGNHFAEFGLLQIFPGVSGLAPGGYTALLTHSGSRGVGGRAAKYYSRMAAELRPGYKKLAWLDEDSPEGREYWRAMSLMGRYSAANHELIHRAVSELSGLQPVACIRNHHNFAWKMDLPGLGRVIVHRKGATPAGRGELGIMPGSMSSPAYVVEGLGNSRSLFSASHGAGRRMSRKQAAKRFDRRQVRNELRAKGIRVLSAGLDEAPGAYKDIDQVLADQSDIVRAVARFEPKIVKMAPGRGGWNLQSDL